MANGATFRQLMFSFGLAENTISLFVPKVLEALIETLKDLVMSPLVNPNSGRELVRTSRADGTSLMLAGHWTGSTSPSKLHQSPVPHTTITRDFYRTMHYSAKRGLAITCRLSVCLSVRLSVRL